MRVLVTGGAGYIGSVIVEQLIAEGNSVVVYDSLEYGHKAALHPNADFVKGNVSDLSLLSSTMKKYEIEAVIHMAAYIQAGESVQDPLKYFKNNVGSGLVLVEAMIAHGVKKLVYSSTAALYGDPETLPIPEDEPQKPTNPYGESKLAFEKMLPWLAKSYGITCTALRYFNAAGATKMNGEAHSPESHLIPLILKAAFESTSVEVYGTDYPTVDGTGVRDYVHVLDLARAHVLALGRETGDFQAYNVGTGQGHSVQEVIDTTRKVTGKEIKVRYLPRRSGDQAATVAASEKVRKELGWNPQFASIESIIKSAWEWKLAHPHGYDE